MVPDDSFGGPGPPPSPAGLLVATDGLDARDAKHGVCLAVAGASIDWISVGGIPVRWAGSEPDGGSATASAELKSIADGKCGGGILSIHDHYSPLGYKEIVKRPSRGESAAGARRTTAVTAAQTGRLRHAAIPRRPLG